MNPKAEEQLTESAKSYIGLIAYLYGEAGVLIIRDLANKKLIAMSKESKTTVKRPKRNKS